MAQNRIKAYALDNDNKLIILTDKKALMPKGAFHIRNNSLFFTFDTSEKWRQVLGLPQRKKFIGTWRLNKNHDLELVLKQEETPVQSILRFQGEIIAAEEDSLDFLFTAKKTDSVYRAQLLKLSGTWSADETNRLIFELKKETGEKDILTLEGGWEVNKNQKIIYRYQKTRLVRRIKREASITFNGFWDIRQKHRLCYIIGKTGHSVFNFTAQLESPNFRGQEKEIKYRVGINASGRKCLSMQTVILFGTWKINKKHEISFEMEYEKGVYNGITFTYILHSAGKNELLLALQNAEGRGLGITVSLGRSQPAQEKELFCRFKKIRQEKEIELGVKIPW
ncbi:MAG: hypothetical protein V1893_00495 [Candidatus Omnitrophota bacterium]